MKETLKALRQYIEEKQPADGESVLGMLYEYHSEYQRYDNERIKADFNALYEQMHGMPLKEVDKVIYAVCTLCRDYERSGFIEGIQLGFQLSKELM